MLYCWHWCRCFVYQAGSERSEFVGELFHIDEHENVFSVAKRLESDHLVVSSGTSCGARGAVGFGGKSMRATS